MHFKISQPSPHVRVDVYSVSTLHSVSGDSLGLHKYGVYEKKILTYGMRVKKEFQEEKSTILHFVDISFQ